MAMYKDETSSSIVQVSNCYQLIASAYQRTEHYRKALEFQSKSHEILTKIYKDDEMIVKNSLAAIDQYTKLSVHKELTMDQMGKLPLPLTPSI
jgi:hypothetical protein